MPSADKLHPLAVEQLNQLRQKLEDAGRDPDCEFYWAAFRKLRDLSKKIQKGK